MNPVLKSLRKATSKRTIAVLVKKHVGDGKCELHCEEALRVLRNHINVETADNCRLLEEALAALNDGTPDPCSVIEAITSWLNRH